MNIPGLQSHLEALTNKLARRWAACDDLMKVAPRFSASHEALREKKQEIDNCWADLLGVYVAAGEDFFRVENKRFLAMTRHRHLDADSADLMTLLQPSGKGPL